MLFQKVPKCSTQFLELYNVTGMNLNIKGCLGIMNFQKVPESSGKFKTELEYSKFLRDYVFPGNSRMFYSILRLRIL